jgi:hypothetical protein
MSTQKLPRRAGDLSSASPAPSALGQLRRYAAYDGDRDGHARGRGEEVLHGEADRLGEVA